MPQISSQAQQELLQAVALRTDKLASSLPFLRRYARAAAGSRQTGDALVRAMLEAALRDKPAHDQISASRIGLFRAFTAMWGAIDLQELPPIGAPEHPPGSQFARVPSVNRKALLLNEMEGFSIVETAEILGISELEAGQMVKAASKDISRQEPARVLIIEDEPLVAQHLEDIVTHCGHQIVAKATTASEARDAFDLHHPTLVLSDVQLADGSSGIDVVEDILRRNQVPVIFITGFPQKLLTGGDCEPTFLITKPFREDTVRTTISQALLFGKDMID